MGAASKWLKGDRQTNFGTLNFWANPFFGIWNPFFMILRPRTQRNHPLQPISRPCSIEKYPSSRMANRYTRIFDAGGKGRIWMIFQRFFGSRGGRASGQLDQGVENPSGRDPPTNLNSDFGVTIASISIWRILLTIWCKLMPMRPKPAFACSSNVFGPGTGPPSVRLASHSSRKMYHLDANSLDHFDFPLFLKGSENRVQGGC